METPFAKLFDLGDGAQVLAFVQSLPDDQCEFRVRTDVGGINSQVAMTFDDWDMAVEELNEYTIAHATAFRKKMVGILS